MGMYYLLLFKVGYFFFRSLYFMRHIIHKKLINMILTYKINL